MEERMMAAMELAFDERRDITVPKTMKGKFRIEPSRALEPAKKKLSSLEGQRIMAVFDETIKRAQVLTLLSHILQSFDRYKVMLGADLTKLIEDQNVTIGSFMELKKATAEAVKQRKDFIVYDERPVSSLSTRSEEEAAQKQLEEKYDKQVQECLRNSDLVAKQLQHCCKNILRQLNINPTVVSTVTKGQQKGIRSDQSEGLLRDLQALKDIIMERLLTTPLEEKERHVYLVEISQRERENSATIAKLQTELDLAIDDKNAEVKVMNDVIRKLQGELNQRETFSKETIKRIKNEAEKQENSDLKNSEGKRQRLQQEINSLRSQLMTLESDHRESELALRRRKFKIETEVENWIQKFDQDMSERHTEYEEIDSVYTTEKRELNELEERFKTLEEEYNQIMEERRIAREKREAMERELQASIAASTVVQAFWRSYKVRKALKAKKKKKGGKKK